MDLILTEIKDQVALITINRPKELNALNRQVLKALSETLSRLKDDPDLRALVITGAGDRAFVAGADIGEMADMDREQAEMFARFGNRVMKQLHQFPLPVIAAINGFALGGGFELALACDLRLASDKASFAFPETGLGITPGFGGTQRLVRQTDPMTAFDLIMTGRRIRAQEARDLGLVLEIVEADQLLDRAWELALTIAKKAPVAVREAKRAIRKGSDLTLDEGLVLEEVAFGRCFDSQDQKIAMEAFLDKKEAPPFQGK